MKQFDFERARETDWLAFGGWLDRRAANAPGVDAIDAAAIPPLYRRIAQDLALARDREYAPALVDRLNALALRGHQALYAAEPSRWRGFLTFIARGFPARVRAERRFVLLAALLFFGPLIGITIAIQSFPEFARVILSPAELDQVASMYAPEDREIGMRNAEANAQMFGWYVWNNTRIGFQTFAGGLVFGLGTLFFLLFNGVYIGAIAGHLIEIGYSEPLFSFVSGHSAPELIAIAIAGGAGLKLGWALIAPGARRRRDALAAEGKGAVALVGGAAVLFLIAAAIEAFWSPLVLADPWPKYAVGIGFWLLAFVYFWRAGRDSGTRDAA